MRPSVNPPGFRRAVTLALAAALVLTLTACAKQVTPASPAAAPSDVILASTTSTQDSGLFDVLIPAFEKDNPSYKVKVIAVGSGAALTLGEKKDADVLLVHSPTSETAFVAKGYGTDRRPVMYNDFLVVGPLTDPAKVKDVTSAAEAFKRIAMSESVFISRGDNSGTYTKEMSVWTSATVETTGATWYVSTGQGMGAVLGIANEKRGYTLVDRATWLTSADKNADLMVVLEGDNELFNPYHVILIPGARNVAGGRAFADWLTGPAGQRVTGDFGTSKFGQQIFVPNAGAAN